MEFRFLYTSCFSSEWRFSYKKYGNLYVSYEELVSSSARETPMFPVCLFFHVSWTSVCVYLCELVTRVFLCGCVSNPSWHRDECYWPWDMFQAEGGIRHPQTVEDWSMHLWDGPVQERNEDRMPSDNSEEYVHKFGFTSGDIKKLTVSAVLMYVCVPGKGCGRLEDSSNVNLAVWCF